MKRYSNTTRPDDGQEDLVGSPTLDRPMRMTRFPNQAATKKKDMRLSLRQMEAEIKAAVADDKDHLPFLKMAAFGGKRTPLRPKSDGTMTGNSLRHDANVLAVSGVEVDLDRCPFDPLQARHRLRKAGLLHLLVTTPSHGIKGNCFRGFFPFSEERAPGERERMVARINGLLGGKLDDASFNLSQSFYIGNVRGRPKVKTWLCDGRYLDTASDLDAGAMGRRGRTKGDSANGKKTPLHVVLDALNHIPNDGSIPENDSREWWLEIGMALHHASGGSAEGAWHEWSARWQGYDADATAAAWDSFGRATGRVRTGQHILNIAERFGWRDLERMFGLFTDDMVDVPFGGHLRDEDGVIRAFAERYEGELLFDHHAGKWFRFNGYWRREDTKLASHYARDESVKLATGDAKAKALKRVSTWEAIERGARTVREFAVTSDVWNRDKMLLGTPGGTVDLRTGKLRDGLPGDHISRVTAVTPIPRFKPERDCPRWLVFLDEARTGDKNAIRFLQQWGGYSLTGETKEQVLVFVYGPGGSGKGTAINTIGDILGDYAVNVGMETLTASKHDRHTTELARLRGARMARASETEKGRAWAENRIKNLTGQDTITARFMRQDDFEFLPEFKLTIFGNNRPSLKDVDAAIKRRFIVLPFDHPPKQKDPELAEKLKAEWPGILSWLIVGCRDWQANGLVRPAVVEDATDAYFAEQDTFGQWLDDRCEIGSQFADTTDALWQSWSRYAYGLGEEPGSKMRTFPETLSQRGFVPIKDSRGIRGRGYEGLHVLSDMREDDETF